jgi:tetratricopeptide (TPR) repeat protein
MLYGRQAREARDAAAQLAREAETARAQSKQLAAMGRKADAEQLLRSAEDRLARAAKQREIADQKGTAAESQYLAAIRVSPRFVEVRDNLARLYYAEGKFLEAETQFRKIIELNSKLVDPYFSLGLMLAEQEGRGQEAAQALSAAARLAPNNPRIRYNYGLALRNLDRMEAAEYELQAAEQLERTNADYVYALVDLYVKQKQWKEAAERAKRLVDLRPDVPQFRAILQRARTEAARQQASPPKQP